MDAREKFLIDVERYGTVPQNRGDAYSFEGYVQDVTAVLVTNVQRLVFEVSTQKAEVLDLDHVEFWMAPSFADGSPWLRLDDAFVAQGVSFMLTVSGEDLFTSGIKDPGANGVVRGALMLNRNILQGTIEKHIIVPINSTMRVSYIVRATACLPPIFIVGCVLRGRKIPKGKYDQLVQGVS